MFHKFSNWSCLYTWLFCFLFLNCLYLYSFLQQRLNMWKISVLGDNFSYDLNIHFLYWQRYFDKLNIYVVGKENGRRQETFHPLAVETYDKCYGRPVLIVPSKHSVRNLPPPSVNNCKCDCLYCIHSKYQVLFRALVARIF